MIFDNIYVIYKGGGYTYYNQWESGEVMCYTTTEEEAQQKVSELSTQSPCDKVIDYILLSNYIDLIIEKNMEYHEDSSYHDNKF